MAATSVAAVSPAVRARRVFLVVAVLAFGVVAVLTAAAEPWLRRRGPVDLGVLSLRLGFNPGISFSLGADLPSWVITVGTAVVVGLLAVAAWRVTRTAAAPGQVGWGLVLAGAAANVVDRGIDGVVTDYFFTGWFPTFNGADVLITTGVVLLLLDSLRTPPAEPTEPDPTNPVPEPDAEESR